MGDHGELVDCEVVEQSVEVEREGASTGAAGDVPGQAEGAVVVGDDAVLLGEARDLLPPDEVIASRAVAEDESGRLGIAVVFVVDVDLVGVQMRNGGVPRAGEYMPASSRSP